MKKKELVKTIKVSGNSYKIKFDPLFAVKSGRGRPLPPPKVFKSKKDYRRHPKHKKRYYEEYLDEY